MPVRLFPSQSAAADPQQAQSSQTNPNHQTAFVLRQTDPDPWLELRELAEKEPESTGATPFTGAASGVNETQPLLGKKKRASSGAEIKPWPLKTRQQFENVCPRSVSWSLAKPNPKDPIKQRPSFGDSDNFNNNHSFENFEKRPADLRPRGSYKRATHRPPSFRLKTSPHPSSLIPPRSPRLVPNGGPTKPSPLLTPDPLWSPASRHLSAVPFAPLAPPFNFFGGGFGRRDYFGGPYQPVKRLQRRQSLAQAAEQLEAEQSFADIRPFGRRRTLASLALAKFKTRVNSKSADSISDLQKSLETEETQKKESTDTTKENPSVCVAEDLTKPDSPSEPTNPSSSRTLRPRYLTRQRRSLQPAYEPRFEPTQEVSSPKTERLQPLLTFTSGKKDKPTAPVRIVTPPSNIQSIHPKPSIPIVLYNQPETEQALEKSQTSDSTATVPKSTTSRATSTIRKLPYYPPKYTAPSQRPQNNRPVYQRASSGYSNRLPSSKSVTARVHPPAGRMWTAEDESDGEESQPSFDLDRNANEVGLDLELED
ncbi:unnamed protein product [Bursaphelenchus xylophilus]|uniref:(pine wood nematode) hypothetical protein n=1 Tax=Bursaphelenchus xylophilus TaxID=6326 RepID=A0A1I7RZC6_BURXY|nr:unnamed protein product [Bursaphelenchus xylophilus]CAG9106604.1 unnamed protein product [Bursaphelenchus xylophilus]